MRLTPACLLLTLSVFALPAAADPTLSVTYDGVNASGNHTWTAWVGPDPALFHQTSSGFGGAMAVELAFAVRESTFVSYAHDTNNWDYENPGFNPFTNNVTFATWTNDDDTLIFGAYGSPVFTDEGPFELLYFETLGDAPTTLDYGQAASGHPEYGATLAQAGQLFIDESASLTFGPNFMNDLVARPIDDFTFFYGYSGSTSSVPEPTALALLSMLAAPLLNQRRPLGRRAGVGTAS